MIKITISREGGHFLADVKAWLGTWPVGRGPSMAAALGDWLYHNRAEVYVTIVLDPSAEAAETRRRARELRKR